MRKVFLSSTFEDLTKHREEVIAAIESLDDYHCVRMENFGARDWDADAFCNAKIAESDIFVGVIGHLYGSCPPGSTTSYTEREYRTAVATNKPRLIFIAPEDFPVPANLVEDDSKRQHQRQLREELSSERIRDTFNSPDDLARRVVQAIRNWEREQTKILSKSVHPIGLLVLPPQPYFAHPYPLQEHFTGRVHERQALTQWFSKGQQPLLAIVAIGGMGKSAVTWAWVQRDVLGLPLPGTSNEPSGFDNASRSPADAFPNGVFWWSFYEQEAHFASFLNEALVYASNGKVNPETIASSYQKVRNLLSIMQQQRILFVLDGFERELRAYASLSAAYQGDAIPKDTVTTNFRSCTDPNASYFLRAATSTVRSKILITSRLFPRELEGLSGCQRIDLESLDAEDAILFFQSLGIKGTRAEMQSAIQPYGYHPLALRLLAGMIALDPARPNDVTVANEYSPIPDLVPKEHHILALAYEAPRQGARKLLSRLAAFRSPVEFDAVKVLSTFKDHLELKQVVKELVERGLLFFDRERARYDMHPIVRQYAYDRLTDKAGVHTKLLDYFAAVPQPHKR